jgi:hypothetical protein
MPKKDLDLSFLVQGSEEIQLPSKGILYGGTEFASGKVHIRPWLTAEEKLIDKFSRGNFYNIIKKLIQSVMEEKTSIDMLTIGDFFYLLYLIRSLSYGPKYTVNIECPKCESSIQNTIDMTKYEVTFLEDCKEPLSIVLPKSGIEVSFRLPRLKDMIEATERTHSDSVKLGATVSPDIFKLARCVNEMTLPNEDKTILTQDEDFDTMLLKIWPKLPAIDLAAFRNEIAKYDHGFVENTFTKCPSCENYFEQAPILSFEFFRPSNGEPKNDDGSIVGLSES